jgi:hypothetical protein
VRFRPRSDRRPSTSSRGDDAPIVQLCAEPKPRAPDRGRVLTDRVQRLIPGRQERAGVRSTPPRRHLPPRSLDLSNNRPTTRHCCGIGEQALDVRRAGLGLAGIRFPCRRAALCVLSRTCGSWLSKQGNCVADGSAKAATILGSEGSTSGDKRRHDGVQVVCRLASVSRELKSRSANCRWCHSSLRTISRHSRT